MKILHVNKFFDFHGGAETYLHSLMKHQRDRGHEVHAFSTKAPKNAPSDDASAFVERYDYARSEGLSRDLKKGLSYLWNRDAERAMKRMIAEIQPDVIHMHNIYHHLSSSVLKPIRAARIPCVQTLHDYKLACPNYKMFTEGSICERCHGGRYMEAVTHHCLSASTAQNFLAAAEMGMTKLAQSYERTVGMFLCPSQFMADKMIAWGEPPSKFLVIPNPIDIPEVSATGDGDYILYAGRLSPEKGIETLVRAMAHVPEARLHIAGTGPEEGKLHALVESLGITTVTFLGFLRSPDLAEVRHQARALAVPSVWYENGPYAVLEAMAEEIPIMSSRIGGLPELVEHGVSGWLVEPGNVDAWVRALRVVVATPLELLRRMGRASQERVKARHLWGQHLDQLEDVYKQLQKK